MGGTRKKFDAIAWVRAVRDQHHELTKDMTPTERLQFDHDRAQRAQEVFEQKAKELQSSMRAKNLSD